MTFFIKIRRSAIFHLILRVTCSAPGEQTFLIPFLPLMKVTSIIFIPSRNLTCSLMYASLRPNFQAIVETSKGSYHNNCNIFFVVAFKIWVTRRASSPETTIVLFWLESSGNDCKMFSF